MPASINPNATMNPNIYNQSSSINSQANRTKLHKSRTKHTHSNIQANSINSQTNMSKLDASHISHKHTDAKYINASESLNCENVKNGLAITTAMGVGAVVQGSAQAIIDANSWGKWSLEKSHQWEWDTNKFGQVSSYVFATASFAVGGAVGLIHGAYLGGCEGYYMNKQQGLWGFIQNSFSNAFNASTPTNLANVFPDINSAYTQINSVAKTQTNITLQQTGAPDNLSHVHQNAIA